jgi:hypothetical protein
MKIRKNSIWMSYDGLSVKVLIHVDDLVKVKILSCIDPSRVGKDMTFTLSDFKESFQLAN